MIDLATLATLDGQITLDSQATLDSQGWVMVPNLLSPEQCQAMTVLYDDDALFRSRVVMARHGFGQGEYRYFTYPLPVLVAALRVRLYEALFPIANRWCERLGLPATYPARHADYRAHCHAVGQTRPTPLLLRYGPGDYNRLHQDLYGAEAFPLQTTVLLSQPGDDFEGGEFVMTEQRPRQQSRAMVVPLRQGDAVVMAVSHRPVRGVRGDYPVTMRHGVSVVRSGSRHALGIIFHDAT